jgi:thiol-disulfide isomerase/thioredoxin
MKKILVVMFAAAVLLQDGANALNSPAKEVKVGDICPNLQFKVVNYSTKVSTINSFHGKLLILDFWGTWCAPCRTFLKKADSIQKQFNGQLVILPVTDEDSSTTMKFVNSYKKINGIDIFSAVRCSYFNNFFPHIYVPHEVWIDQMGKVIAITDESEVTPEKVQKALEGQASFKMKTDHELTNIDYKRPVLTGNQGVSIPDSLLLYRTEGRGYRAIITGWMPNLEGITSVANDDMFICFNNGLTNIYKYIYGEFGEAFINSSRVVLDVRDSSQFVEPDDREKKMKWAVKNVYCFEISLTDTTLRADKFKIAQRVLSDYFSKNNIVGSIKEIKKDCYILKKIGAGQSLDAKDTVYKEDINAFGIAFRNARFGNLFFRLQTYYLQALQVPILDESGIEDKRVDMDLSCNMSDLNSINNGLKKYGYGFVKEQRTEKYIVISEF